MYSILGTYIAVRMPDTVILLGCSAIYWHSQYFGLLSIGIYRIYRVNFTKNTKNASETGHCGWWLAAAAVQLTQALRWWLPGGWYFTHLGRGSRIPGLGLLGKPPCTGHPNSSGNPSSREPAAAGPGMSPASGPQAEGEWHWGWCP